MNTVAHVTAITSPHVSTAVALQQQQEAVNFYQLQQMQNILVPVDSSTLNPVSAVAVQQQLEQQRKQLQVRVTRHHFSLQSRLMFYYSVVLCSTNSHCSSSFTTSWSNRSSCNTNTNNSNCSSTPTPSSRRCRSRRRTRRSRTDKDKSRSKLDSILCRLLLAWRRKLDRVRRRYETKEWCYFE